MAGAWRRESGGGSVGKFLYSIIFENLFLKNDFYCMIQTVSFSHWYGKVERGVIIWFVVCFSTTYFCWGGSMETGAWGHDGDKSKFF